MKNYAFTPVRGKSSFVFWAAIISLFLSSTATHAQSCLRWVLRSDVGSPGPRYAHSMCYDEVRGVTYFFGGEYSLVGGEPEFFNDVWEYDGIRWRQLVTTGTPPLPQAYATILPIKESAADGTPMYGFTLGIGIGYRETDDNELITHSNLKKFLTRGDGTGTWTRSEANASPPRGSLGTGGVNWESVAIGEFNWYSLNYGGLPLVLNDHQAVGVYRNSQWLTLVLGGGQMRVEDNLEGRDNPSRSPSLTIVETALIAGSWQKLSMGPQPKNRFQHVAAYDSDRERVVMFGGAGFPDGDLHWELKIPKEGGGTYPADDIQWERVNLPSMPQPRALAGMVYDAKRRVMVLLGGVGGARYGDTWELVSIPLVITGETNFVSCLGKPVTFVPFHNAGREVRRQWYFADALNGGAWSPVTGGTTDQLEVNPVETGLHRYRFEMADACGNVAERIFQVTVHTKPSVSLNFSRFEACPGESIVLTARVASTLDFTVQWYKDGKAIGGKVTFSPTSLTDSFDIPSVKPTDTGIYSVVAANECGATTNAQINMTSWSNPEFQHLNGRLQVGPTIESEPSSREEQVCTVPPTLFSVQADGVKSLNYQWRLDGKPIAAGGDFTGVNTSRLAISRPLLYKHEGNYDVIVWDDCGLAHSVTSQVATLTLKPGPEWVFRTTNAPPSRFQHTMAYDSARRVSVMFGGYFHSPTTFGTYNDLWEWNGMLWARRMEHSAASGWKVDADGHWSPTYAGDRPVARAEHAMTYDPKRGRTVIFGGSALDPGGVLKNLNDTWEWDGTRWYFRGTNGPNFRTSAALAYNSHRETAVLFGGYQLPDDPAINVLWEWNGTAWKTNATVNNPSRTTTASMAYDSFREAMFFGPTAGFSGILHDIFWTLSGTNWTATSMAFNNDEVTAPYSRMVFDHYKRRSVVTFGVKGSTGFWDGQRWKVFSSPVKPQFRFWHGLAYDSARHASVLFGGASAFANTHYPNTNDTWELIAVDVPLVNESPASQYRVAKEPATFRVAAVGPPGLPLRYQWFRDEVPLVSDGRISGTTTGTLTLAAVQPPDAGSYTVRVGCDCGETTSPPGILTLNPALQIFSTAGSTTLVWSDPQVVLEQADNPAGPWTVVPGVTSPFNPATLGPAKFFRLRTVQ